MLEFLKQCEINPYVNTQQKKIIIGIRKGVIEQKTGRFLSIFTYKGIRYTKFFSQEPRSDALKDAIEWMQNKKEEVIQDEETLEEFNIRLDNEYLSSSEDEEF